MPEPLITVTVRVPRGTPEKVRAISGHDFSFVVRTMVQALIAKHEQSSQT